MTASTQMTEALPMSEVGGQKDMTIAEDEVAPFAAPGGFSCEISLPPKMV